MGLRERKCCHRAKIEDDEQVEVMAVALVFSYIEVLGSASCHSKIRRYVAVISRDIRKYCGCFVGPSHTVHGWSPCSNRKKKSESKVQSKWIPVITSATHTHTPPRGEACCRCRQSSSKARNL